MNFIIFNRGMVWRFILYCGCMFIAMITPIFLWNTNLPFIQNSYGKNYELFEICGFCMSIAIFFIIIFEIKIYKKPKFSDILPTLIFAIIAFHYLIIVISEYGFMSYDYRGFENTAREIIQNVNPYNARYSHIYPPLLMQVIAMTYRGIQLVNSFFMMNLQSESMWYCVFYLYQCCQYILILTAYLLCYCFVRGLGVNKLNASLLTAGLFIMNNPLLSLIRWNQTNLWMLNTILIAVLLGCRYPWLAGLCVAVSFHIKLLPLILLVPYFLMKYYRVVIWSVIAIIAIVIIQTNFGMNVELWSSYLENLYLKSDGRGTCFIDSGIHSVIFNCYRSIMYFMGKDMLTFKEKYNGTISFLYYAAIACFIFYFVCRFLKREKSYKFMVNEPLDTNKKHKAEIIRFNGNLFDWLALGLIIFPRVQVHFYILALPIIIWAIITEGCRRPWRIGIGVFLILALPTYVIFPFSYNRLAGLLILLFSMPPPIAINNKWLLSDL